MKQKFCPECGEPIVCSIERPDLYFYIDTTGKVRIDGNPNIWFNRTVFHCSSDFSHDLSSLFSDEETEWETEFLERVKSILMGE
jgi:hypothetical protein